MYLKLPCTRYINDRVDNTLDDTYLLVHQNWSMQKKYKYASSLFLTKDMTCVLGVHLHVIVR